MATIPYTMAQDLSTLMVTSYNEYRADMYLLKVSNRNTRKMWGIYSKLTIKSSKRRHHHNDVVLLFLLLTLNMFYNLSSVSIVEFEQVNVCWV